MTFLDSFSNNRNGRGAMLALKAAFAGKAVWEKIIEDSENFLDNRKCTGKTDITLERHAYGHQEGYTSITESAEHVQHQIST